MKNEKDIEIKIRADGLQVIRTFKKITKLAKRLRRELKKLSGKLSGL